MATARPGPAADGWTVSLDPVGPTDTLLARLRAAASGGPVALGLDVPLGIPRAFAARGTPAPDAPAADFPALLRALPPDSDFFRVADRLDEVGPGRPFFPRRATAGVTRLSHARALGLDSAACLSRACDRATPLRPAGAPVFWTLGANQSGKAGISAWRDVLGPALRSADPPLLWPFAGPFRALLRPGTVAVAEAYPAESLRQIGLRPVGSKRRHADRAALARSLRGAMPGLRARPDPALDRALAEGFGTDAAGEDRMDCTIGLLAMLSVLDGTRPDTAPPDPVVRRWEGWVLGQAW